MLSFEVHVKSNYYEQVSQALPQVEEQRTSFYTCMSRISARNHLVGRTYIALYVPEAVVGNILRHSRSEKCHVHMHITNPAQQTLLPDEIQQSTVACAELHFCIQILG